MVYAFVTPTLTLHSLPFNLSIVSEQLLARTSRCPNTHVRVHVQPLQRNDGVIRGVVIQGAISVDPDSALKIPWPECTRLRLTHSA